MRWYEESTVDYYFDEEEAYRYEAFFPKFLTHVKGELGGQPLELMDWVRHDIIRPLFGVKRRSDDTRRFRTVYCEIPRKNAKALCLNTPVTTYTGKRTSIGALAVGDIITAADGQPTRITHTSQVFRDKKCYSVAFDGVRPIIASSDHLWTVRDELFGTSTDLYLTLTTEELLRAMEGGDSCASDARFSVGGNSTQVGPKRRLISITPCETVPTKCIAVDSPSRCFLVGQGIPTHNTTIAAGIALAVLFLDQEWGAEIYSAAADRQQANICFSIAQQMINNNKVLDSRCKVHRNKIFLDSTGSSYQAVSAEAHTKHGFNAHCIIFDELHAQPNRELWDVLHTSTGSRTQPILFAITTAGYDKTSICYEVHSYAKKVRDGQIKDESFLPIIYGADDGDDWREPKVWAKANPGLGISVRLDYIERECEKAKELPSYENTFRMLHLNQWVESQERWISSEAWNKCVGRIDLGELEGRACYAGLDLSSTQDMTALVLAFDYGTRVKLLPFFWIPEEGIFKRSRKDKVPYEEWQKRGLLENNPGGAIDYELVLRKIYQLAEIYEIREIAVDKWNAQHVMTKLDDRGMNVVPVASSNISYISGATMEFERLVLSQELEHGNHPILSWCLGNTVVKMNSDGRVRPDKEKSTEKIDGISASILAISRWMVQSDPTSVYSDRGLRTL